MAGIEARTFAEPDEHRPFEGKGHMDIVTLGGRTVGRGVFEPGWRWSVNVKPIHGTASCQFPHFGYVLQGRLRVIMDDGEEAVVGAGEVVRIAPGHDAEVVGDEAFVMIDLGDEDADYARRT